MGATVMVQHFEMRRRGTFKTGKGAPNQCATVRKRKFSYEVKLTFRAGTPLEVNGFLVDHNTLDAAVTGEDSGLVGLMAPGSCEQLHEMLYWRCRRAVGPRWAYVRRYRAAIWVPGGQAKLWYVSDEG